MTVTKICTFIFNFNYDTTPLWYLYMLIGLYFVIPVFGAWLDRASQKDVKLFLRIWGISLFLPYLKMAAPALGYIGNWGNMDILGVCDWNAFGSFYYVSGFIGYLILAYYLVKYPCNGVGRKPSPSVYLCLQQDMPLHLEVTLSCRNTFRAIMPIWKSYGYSAASMYL